MRRFLRFGRQLRLQPFDDAALERDRAITLPDQHRRHVGTGEFCRIRVVHDDLAIPRNGRRRAVGLVPDGPGQTYGAVLVRVLQAGIDKNRCRVALELLFEIFFGDAWDRHETGIVPGPRAQCQLRVSWQPRR